LQDYGIGVQSKAVGTKTPPTALLFQRRFPPPWSIEELEACFVVRDHGGQKLAYVYFEEEPGRRSAAKLLTKGEARRIAVNFAKLPALLQREDEFGNSRRSLRHRNQTQPSRSLLLGHQNGLFISRYTSPRVMPMSCRVASLKPSSSRRSRAHRRQSAMRSLR
jgi:hypothetical protein